MVTSQKNTFGFVAFIMDFISNFPNDGSIALIGQPKHSEANTIGAKSGPLFAIIPNTHFGSTLNFCRFWDARMVLVRISWNVDCSSKSSLIWIFYNGLNHVNWIHHISENAIRIISPWKIKLNRLVEYLLELFWVHALLAYWE